MPAMSEKVRKGVGVSGACVPPAAVWVRAGGVKGPVALGPVKSNRLRAREALAGWECLGPSAAASHALHRPQLCKP